ncbi:MAG: putative glycoside hydrolase, partial [Eubacterium sp.]|nr:putative glycoside hydrolase [Eubacterium sp.]
MKKRKRKRFYKNVKRNQTWTEEIQGREIDFADKYASDGVYSDKFDYLRPKSKPKNKKKKLRKKAKKTMKIIGYVFICLAIVFAGYAAMDVYMIRHRMPDLADAVSDKGDGFNKVSINLESYYIDSVSLDNAVMLSSVISDAQSYSFSSAAFDIKREDGSVTYRSALANVDTYGAVAFPSAKFKESVEELTNSDILPVGIVSCYRDNVVPAKDSTLAVLDNGKVYTDNNDNTYLNPNADSAYRYIKDIIAEANSQGVKVFVLSNTRLPNDIREKYSDGFDAISAKLYADIGTDIKLLEAVDVSLSDKAADDDSDEISEKIKNNPRENQVYYIKTSADKYLIKEKLEESGITN